MRLDFKCLCIDLTRHCYLKWGEDKKNISLHGTVPSLLIVEVRNLECVDKFKGKQLQHELIIIQISTNISTRSSSLIPRMMMNMHNLLLPLCDPPIFPNFSGRFINDLLIPLWRMMHYPRNIHRRGCRCRFPMNMNMNLLLFTWTFLWRQTLFCWRFHYFCWCFRGINNRLCGGFLWAADFRFGRGCFGGSGFSWSGGRLHGGFLWVRFLWCHIHPHILETTRWPTSTTSSLLFSSCKLLSHTQNSEHTWRSKVHRIIRICVGNIMLYSIGVLIPFLPLPTCSGIIISWTIRIGNVFAAICIDILIRVCKVGGMEVSEAIHCCIERWRSVWPVLQSQKADKSSRKFYFI